MEIEFADPELERLANDEIYCGTWDRAVVKAYRKKLQQIVAAVDERDLRYPGGNHFEKLQGDRAHQHSMRLNDQWRLILELARGEDGAKTARIIEIKDYH